MQCFYGPLPLDTRKKLNNLILNLNPNSNPNTNPKLISLASFLTLKPRGHVQGWRRSLTPLSRDGISGYLLSNAVMVKECFRQINAAVDSPVSDAAGNDVT